MEFKGLGVVRCAPAAAETLLSWGPYILKLHNALTNPEKQFCSVLIYAFFYILIYMYGHICTCVCGGVL